MSFSTQIEQIIKAYGKKIATHFSLPEDEVYALFNDKEVKENKVKEVVKVAEVKEEDPDTMITKEKIMKANKDMLAAMCKQKNLKMSGKKDELIARLVEYLENNKSSQPVSSSSSKSPVKSKKTEEPVVIKKTKERAGELAIRKNKFGNFEHMQTGLVFNTDKIVFGKQLEDGEISELVTIDIEICKKYKFPYKTPENLNVNKNLEDINIEELDEEEELDNEDIEDEVEEEEEDVIEDEI